VNGRAEWRGHGSALFLEFGELAKARKVNGKPGHPVGDLSLMVEWSWTVENKNSILGGSWSNEPGWPRLFKRLLGKRVRSARSSGIYQKLQWDSQMDLGSFPS